MQKSFRFGLCVAMTFLTASIVHAEDADEHAAHHGSASPAGGVAAGSMASSGMQPAGEMQSMMGERMEGEHGGRRQSPFFSQLLALPALDDAARQALLRQAEQRSHRGLMLISEAARAAAHAETATEQIAAVRNLREGSDLLDSGVAARMALAGTEKPEGAAMNWFRDRLSIEPDETHAAHPFGLSPSHLLLMMFLLLLSTGLAALQLLRLKRIRRIVAAGKGAAKVVNPQPSLAAVPEIQAATTGTLAPSNAPAPAGASLRKPRPWTGPLRVTRIIRETPTIRTFRLADPSADRLPFDFLPGQFLQIEVEPEPGKRARRSYTIASSPTQRAYVELTVKREEQGAVSRHLHDTLIVGDLVRASGPFGTFIFTGTTADSIVLIAGGVGITPMMSVLRYLTDTAWPGDIFFLYGARSTDEFVFRDEIERLERLHDNLHVFAAMERSPGTVWHGAVGPLTRDMLLSAVPDIARRRIHLCGPPAMMAAMKAELAELGVPEAQLHTEAFGPASLPIDPVEAPDQPGNDASRMVQPPAAPPAPSTGVAEASVTFALSGVSAALAHDQTVLEAAEGVGVEIPYSCRSGDCGLCVTKLLDGEVTMANEAGLAPEDKANGYILACQAKGSGKPIVVEA